MSALLQRVSAGLARRIRIRWLRSLGVKIGQQCWIQSVEIPRNHDDIALGDRVALDRHVTLLCTGPRQPHPRIVIGSGVYINRYTMLDASDEIWVGADTMIGPYCYIADHDHGMLPGQKIRSQPLVGEPVHIGEDVWIGAQVTILKGVRIGSGAVIGAGAVVTRHVPSGAKVAGVPARQIGIRAYA